MPQRKKRRHPNKTTYTISINPTKTRAFSIKGRKKPRKARLALIKQFNELVNKGIISNLIFDENGSLVDANVTRKLTQNEIEIIRKTGAVLSEPAARKEPPLSKIESLQRKLFVAMKEHERRGNFDFILGRIELDIMDGKDPSEIEKNISSAVPAALKRKIANYNKTSIERNLRKQMRYFERHMKDKKLKKMNLIVRQNKTEESLTTIEIDRNRIIKETKVNSFAEHVTVVSRVILMPNGEIDFKHKETKINTEKFHKRF